MEITICGICNAEMRKEYDGSTESTFVESYDGCEDGVKE